MIVRPKEKNEPNDTPSSQPTDSTNEVIQDSALVEALNKEVEVLRSENKRLKEAMKEQQAVFNDRLIEIYSNKDEPEDTRSTQEKKIQSCIDFLNKFKKKKMI